jgi:plastocyanin
VSLLGRAPVCQWDNVHLGMARNLISLAVAVAALSAPAVAHAATTNVQITRAGFIPDSIKVTVGDTVTWTNADTQDHQVISKDAPFASPVLKPTTQFSYTFTKEGRFSIEDPLPKPRLRMTVQVDPPPPGVTLAASAPIVVYSRTVTLTGRVSNGQANERVTVLAQACGGTFARVGEATTTTGGAWTLAVKPLNNTSYRVQWKTATSAVASVKVRPRLVLTRVAPKRFSLRVTAAASFAGKTAAVQRFDAVRKVWVRVRVVTLRALTGATAPTVASGLRFGVTVSGRPRVRVVLGQAAVGTCYLPGTSNAVVS